MENGPQVKTQVDGSVGWPQVDTWRCGWSRRRDPGRGTARAETCRPVFGR